MNRRTNRGSAAGFIACGLLALFVLALVWTGRDAGGQNFPTIGQVTSGGGGSVSNYNQLNPLFFNSLTTTNGFTNTSPAAPIQSASGFYSSGGPAGVLSIQGGIVASNGVAASGTFAAANTNGGFVGYGPGPLLTLSNTAAATLNFLSLFSFTNLAAFWMDAGLNEHMRSTNAGWFVEYDANTNRVLTYTNAGVPTLSGTNVALVFTNSGPSAPLLTTNLTAAGQYAGFFNGTNFQNSGNANVGQQLQVAGQSFQSNTVFITAGGGNFTGTVTNANTVALSTNISVWSGNGITLDASLPEQTIVIGTNATVLGWANLQKNTYLHPVQLWSNSSGGLVTVTWPAGTAMFRPNSTNQPVTSCTVTNGKFALSEQHFIPYLGTTVTGLVWQTQQN